MNHPYLYYACRCARPCPCQARPRSHSHLAATAVRAKVALALADLILAATEVHPVARQLAMADGGAPLLPGPG